MGRFIILPLLGLLTLGYATKCPRQSPGREILCYTTSLDTKLLENSICRCTTVVHQGHDLQDLGKIGLENLRKSLKQLNPALQFVMSINDARGILKTSADSRQEAIARISGITNQVDGVELNVTAGSKERLVHFLQGLKNEMVRKSRDKRIIMALPTKAEQLAKYYDIKELAKYVDLFSIPTHYLIDDKDNYQTFHPSRLMGLFDLLNTDSLVDLVHGLGAAKRKILVSLPASSYKFTLKIKDQNTPSSPAKEKTPILMNRVQLCNEISQGEWTIERDEDLTAPYAFKDYSWIAFEDKISTKIKGKYVLLRDLAGLGIRDIENDLPNNCGKMIIEDVHQSFTTNRRKSREAVLMSLEDDIYKSENLYPKNLKSSEFRIARIVDTEGAIHAVRENTHTEFTCPKQGYYVHPKSCNRFYRCVQFDQRVEQYSIFEFDCPAGLAFDETTEVCVWPGSLPEGSACPGSPEIAPSSAKRFQCPGEGYYADPHNCRWFFACMDLGAKKMMAYEFQCPYGLVFDEHKLACEWPWLVPKCAGTGYERKDYGGMQEHGHGGYDGSKENHGGHEGGYGGGHGVDGHDDGSYKGDDGKYDDHGGYDGKNDYDKHQGGHGEHDGEHGSHGGGGYDDGSYKGDDGKYDDHGGYDGKNDYDKHQGGHGEHDGEHGSHGDGGYDDGSYKGDDGKYDGHGENEGGYDSHEGDGHKETGYDDGSHKGDDGKYDGHGIYDGNKESHGEHEEGYGGSHGTDGHEDGSYEGHDGKDGSHTVDGHDDGSYKGDDGKNGSHGDDDGKYDGHGEHEGGYGSHEGEGHKETEYDDGSYKADGEKDNGHGGYDGKNDNDKHHGGNDGHEDQGHQGGYGDHKGGHGGEEGYEGDYSNQDGHKDTGYDDGSYKGGDDGHGEYDSHQGEHGGYDANKDQDHHGGYDENKGHEDNQGHGGTDHKEGGQEVSSHGHDDKYDDGHEGGHEDQSLHGGDKTYDGHTGDDNHGEHGKDGYAGGYDINQGGHDAKEPSGYDYPGPGDSKNYDGRGSDENYNKKEYPSGSDGNQGGHEVIGHAEISGHGEMTGHGEVTGHSEVTGHGEVMGHDVVIGHGEVTGHGGYDSSSQGVNKKYQEDEVGKEYHSPDQGHSIEYNYYNNQDGYESKELSNHPGYEYPTPEGVEKYGHEIPSGHEGKDINIHGGFGMKTTDEVYSDHSASSAFTSFGSTRPDHPSIPYNGYTPSAGLSYNTYKYSSAVDNAYTGYDRNHQTYPSTLTGAYVTPAVETGGGKIPLTTLHGSSIYRGGVGRLTEGSRTVLTSPHQDIGVIGGITQPGFIQAHSGKSNTAGYSMNYGIKTGYDKSTLPQTRIHGTTPGSLISDVFIPGQTAAGVVPESKVTLGNEYYTNQAQGSYTQGFNTKNKIGYTVGTSSAAPGRQYYTKQSQGLSPQSFTNQNNAGIHFGGSAPSQENKYYTNQGGSSFTSSIKSKEQGFTPSISVTASGNQYYTNQAGESFTSDKIDKTPAVYTPVSYTTSNKYFTNNVKTSISNTRYQKTPSELGKTSSINYSGAGNQYYTNQAGSNKNIGFSPSSGSYFTSKQSVVTKGNQYYPNQAGISTPSSPEEVPITPINDGSGYKTNEYHDNGGRGTIRYNNGVVTRKYTEDDIRDYRTDFTVFPTAEITETSTFTPASIGGVYTRGGFTKTGPTKTGITTAQVGGTGTYITGGISSRPTASPDEIGENAFGTVSKNIPGNVNSLSYSTPSSNIDNSRTSVTQSSIISSGYSYDIPENSLKTHPTEAPAPHDYSRTSSPYFNIQVYNTKESTTPFSSINTQSHSIPSSNLDGLHANDFSRISGTQSSSLSSGYSYDKPRNQFNTSPTETSVTPQGHSSPFFDIQVYNRKGISTPSPTTTSPDALNTRSYAKSTGSLYQENMYQSGKSSSAAPTGEYFKPIPQRKYPTVSSTAQPVGYTTGPLDNYKTTILNAAKVPVAVSTVRPVYDIGHKTIISTTAIPVAVENDNYNYNNENSFTGSIVTKDDSYLDVGINFEHPRRPSGPAITGKITPSVNYQYSTKSQDSTNKYAETDIGSLGYSLGNVDGDFGHRIDKGNSQGAVDDRLAVKIQPQVYKRPSTTFPTNRGTYNKPIEIGGSYKDSSKPQDLNEYKYTKPTEEFNSGSVVAVKSSSTLSPSQSVTTSPNFNIGIYNNEVAKPETAFNRGNLKFTPSDEYDDTKYSSGLSRTKTINYSSTSRLGEDEGTEINIKNQQKSEFVTPKSSVSESSTLSPSILSRKPSLDDQTRISTYAPPITTYSGNYRKSLATSSYLMTEQSMSKSKGKVIVKFSDLHPILLGKLSAECTCKSDPFASFRGNKPLLIESDKGKVDLRNYDESDVYVDLENSKEPNIYNDDDDVEPTIDRSSASSALISTHESPIARLNEAAKSRRPSSSYLPASSTPRPPSLTYLPSTTASSLLRVSASDIEASSHSSRVRSRGGKSLGSSRSNDLSKEKASDRSDFGEIGVLELNPQGRAECARPGLFRHPKLCNKFYACHWDDWKKKFTLHIFNCPIHLTFDSNAGACNWPSKGPACQDDNLLI